MDAAGVGEVVDAGAEESLDGGAEVEGDQLGGETVELALRYKVKARPCAPAGCAINLFY